MKLYNKKPTALLKLLVAIAISECTFCAFASNEASTNLVDLDQPIFMRYEVPNNPVYSALKIIIEVQGHKQLGLSIWKPGNNDLTTKQLSHLDFSKLDLSSFTSTLSPNVGAISIGERLRQVAKQNADYDQLVRKAASEGIIHPLSDVNLSHDDINSLISKASATWHKSPTPENRSRYISALGMLAARHGDLVNAQSYDRYFSQKTMSEEFTPRQNMYAGQSARDDGHNWQLSSIKYEQSSHLPKLQVTDCFYQTYTAEAINEAYRTQTHPDQPTCDGLTEAEVASIDFTKINFDYSRFLEPGSGPEWEDLKLVGNLNLHSNL